MKNYVLVETRDPFEDGDGQWYRRLAGDLKGRGHEVSLFLAEGGVVAAVKRANGGFLDAIKKTGVSIHADEFSLRERGFDRTDVAPGIVVSPLDFIIERMASGDAVTWR